MPKGNEDQPGQIDLMYSLRIIDRGWTSGAEAAGDRLVREGVEVARRLDVRRPREQHLRRDDRRVHRGREAGSRTRRRRSSRRSPRTAVAAERQQPRAAPGGRGPGGGRGDGGPSCAARPAGALRQPGVSARRRSRIARRPRRRAKSRRGRSGCSATTCAQCHRFGTLGKDYAPDLTKVADRMPRRDILRSIFFPNEKVDPKYAHDRDRDEATAKPFAVWWSARRRRKSS